jgi:hypothetical protein
MPFLDLDDSSRLFDRSATHGTGESDPMVVERAGETAGETKHEGKIDRVVPSLRALAPADRSIKKRKEHLMLLAYGLRLVSIVKDSAQRSDRRISDRRSKGWSG